MSRFTTPKTDWTINDRFNIEDYNRIKNNLNYLHEKSEEIYGEYDIADMGEDVLSHAGFWNVATFNEFETNLETINAHMINAEIGLKQTFYPNGVFIGYAELNRIENATLTLKAVIDGWYEGMKVLSFRLGGSQIGSDRIQRKDSVLSIAVTGTGNVHAYLDEPLDLTGITVTATYKSGETANVTSDCVFNPANGTIMTQTGQQTIAVSYTEDGKTVTSSFTVNVGEFNIWTDGTDAQVIEALNKHYAGEIDLHQKWNVGDERTVHLSEVVCDNTYYDKYFGTQPAQDITFVILHKGGETLKEPIGSHTECAFIIGMKNALSNKVADAYDLDTTQIYYLNANTMFYGSLPETFRSAFKVFDYKYGWGENLHTRSYTTKLGVLTEKQVFNTNGYNNAESSLTYLDYYKTASNRIKTLGDNGQEICQWYLATKSGSYENSIVQTDGTKDTYQNNIEIYEERILWGMVAYGII